MYFFLNLLVALTNIVTCELRTARSFNIPCTIKELIISKCIIWRMPFTIYFNSYSNARVFVFVQDYSWLIVLNQADAIVNYILFIYQFVVYKFCIIRTTHNIIIVYRQGWDNSYLIKFVINVYCYSSTRIL